MEQSKVLKATIRIVEMNSKRVTPSLYMQLPSLNVYPAPQWELVINESWEPVGWTNEHGKRCFGDCSDLYTHVLFMVDGDLYYAHMKWRDWKTFHETHPHPHVFLLGK